MAPARRPITAPMLTEKAFQNERRRIYTNDWDTADMETNTEGAFTPYVPTREDLDAWLAYWRGIYPERGAAKRGGSEVGAGIGGGVAVKGMGKGKVVDDGMGGENGLPGSFCVEQESRVGGEWEPHSEGLKALEEGRGGWSRE